MMMVRRMSIIGNNDDDDDTSKEGVNISEDTKEKNREGDDD
jgi:hypothetical protein